MATDDKISRLGTFSILFNKNVPHVQEKIFFSLDYDSLKACEEVCKTWHELLGTEPYQVKSKELLEKKKTAHTVLIGY